MAGARFCSVPREQREAVVRNTVRSWFLSGKDIPDSYEDACYDLLPTIRSRSFIEFTILQLTNEGNRGPNWPYQIVGDQEADVKAGRISISSPIARALIGKEVGDSIEVNAPGGSKAYEILAVNWG